MKSKFVSFITVSLATSILLVPAQKAFGFGAASQTNLKQTQQLVSDRESHLGGKSEATHNQGLLKEGKTTNNGQTPPTHSVAAASQTTDSSQPSSVEQTARLNHTVGGLFVTVLFISYILVKIQSRKHSTNRAAVLLQQIETLERIWKMNPQQR